MGCPDCVDGRVVRVALERRWQQGRHLTQSISNPGDYFHTVLESVSILPWVADALSLDFIWAGPQTAQLLGYAAADWLQPEFRSRVLHPQDRARVLTALRQLRDKELVVDYRLQHRAGGIVWCQDRIRRIDTASGSHLLVGALVDISEQRRNAAETAAAQLRNAQLQTLAEVGRVATRIAHDFNNLLTLVMGNVELVLSVAEVGERLSAEDLSALRRVQEASERAGEFTRQLSDLDMARHAKSLRVDAGAALTSVAPLLGQTLVDDGRLELELGADLGNLDLEPGQLEHIALSLVSGCSDSMPPAHVLTLAASRELISMLPATAVGEFSPGWHLKLAVACPWRPAADFARWDQPFLRQVGRSENALGLSGLLASVVKAGGHIDVRDSGTGCCVELFLPLPQAHEAAVETTSDYLRHGRRLRVMVCEDPGFERQYISRALSGFGHSVVASLSASELNGQHIPQPEALDLLVLEANQGALARQMLDRNDKLKVLLITEDGHCADPIMTRSSVQYLPRPFGNRELAEHISELLD